MSLNLNPNFAEPGQRYFHKFSPGDDFYEIYSAERSIRIIGMPEFLFAYLWEFLKTERPLGGELYQTPIRSHFA